MNSKQLDQEHLDGNDGNGPNSKSNGSTIGFGPGLLVTAAFIGPGTVTTASIAGANYGFSLVWAVAFAVIATIVLQEMAARLGIVSGGGLAQAIRDSIKQPVGRGIALTLVLGAILFGNSAYQTGNLVGAASGLREIAKIQTEKSAGEADSSLPANTEPDESDSDKEAEVWAKRLIRYGVLSFAAIAVVVIWIGRLELVKWLMAFLVVLMSAMFLYSAISSGPDWSEVFAGLIPRIPAAEDRPKMILFVIGLIGTTVVPYNLFLHASGAAEKWHDADADDSTRQNVLRISFWDTMISVAIGGVVTVSILITMSVAFAGSEVKLTELSQVGAQLENSLGVSARVLFAIGLCAAGLSSAIAAPIAAAYATAGCFQWPAKLSDVRLKCVATFVVLVGVGFGVGSTSSPEEIIILAQVANGLLLPLVAIFLLWVANQKNLLGQFRNRWYTNVLAAVVILITLALASQKFVSVFNKLMARFTE